jgi:hypothetical protein
MQILTGSPRRLFYDPQQIPCTLHIFTASLAVGDAAQQSLDTLLGLSSVHPGNGGMSIVHRPVWFPAHYLVKRRGQPREAVKGHSDKKPAATGEDAEKNVFVTVADTAGCNRYTDGQQSYPYFPGTVHLSTTPIPRGNEPPFALRRC